MMVLFIFFKQWLPANYSNFVVLKIISSGLTQFSILGKWRHCTDCPQHCWRGKGTSKQWLETTRIFPLSTEDGRNQMTVWSMPLLLLSLSRDVRNSDISYLSKWQFRLISKFKSLCLLKSQQEMRTNGFYQYINREGEGKGDRSMVSDSFTQKHSI